MELSFKGENVNLPDFMLVGAAKSGTTTIYRTLVDHPRIYFPPSEKEPFYFCFGGKEPRGIAEGIKKRVTWKTSDYLKLYENVRPEELAGDGSTAYLYRHSDVIPNMERLYGSRTEDIKIIIGLRNPVDRAYSHYTFLVRNGFEDLSFEDAISQDVIAARRQGRWGFDYLEYGSYADQVAHFKSRFPKCKVYLMEDLNEKQALFNSLTEFLQIEPITVEKDFHANPSGIPKNRVLVEQMRKNKVMKWAVNQLPEGVKHKVLDKRDRMMSRFLIKEPMNSHTRAQLVEYFQADLSKLESIIDRDLMHWRK